MKMHLRTPTAGLALLALVAFALPARADDTLDRGVGSEWSSLDPHVNFDAAAAWILADAYEGLVNFDSKGALIPGAAESWERGGPRERRDHRCLDPRCDRPR